MGCGIKMIPVASVCVLLTDSSANPLGTIDTFTVSENVQIIYQIKFVESGDADVFANIIASISASLILFSL